MSRLPRVAVIGSGISGLAAAYALREHANLIVYEAQPTLGGHTRTIDVTVQGQRVPVDTGFLVYNERTYPRLIALFEELDVPTAASDMSFSVQAPGSDLEWSGCNLNTVFAQRSNLWRGEFWSMLRDILRFNRITTALALDWSSSQPSTATQAEMNRSMGEFLACHRFSRTFCEGYFLPMVGSIWSCPTDQMLAFPVETMVRFCHNHGLIQVTGRPQWRTVAGGARQYVQRMAERLRSSGALLHTRTPVRQVRRDASGPVWVSTDQGTERFDHVVLATHSDQSLAMLSDPCAMERDILGAVRYQPNRAVLHTDTRLMPRRRLAWAAWNYERAAHPQQERNQVCLHYWLNRLQPLPVDTPLIETLNPVREPRPETVLDEHEFAHPVFDRAAIDAQARMGALQGRRNTWYCGAWLGYGFHEDGLKSGWHAAQGLLDHLAAQSLAPVPAAEQVQAA